MSKVAIVKCTKYDEAEVKASVAKAIASVIDLSQIIKPGTRVLLKPNILMGYSPERAVTTHPLVLLAVGSLVKELGAEIWVGDSGGFGATARNAQKAGLLEIIESLGARLIPFDDPVEVNVPTGKFVRHFKLERAVVEADVIINLPKLKTHGLTYYTGAAKNLYGCLPGLEKGKGHMKMPSRELFSELIVDLNQAVKPHLNVMDAIIGMEGHGPSNGDPRYIGLILASADTFALDAIGSQIIGLAPLDVPYLKIAAQRGLLDLQRLEVTGERLQDVKISGFKLVKQISAGKKFRNVLLKILGSFTKNLLLEKPVLNSVKCHKCNVCVEVCPVKTITGSVDGPVFNYKNCIHCYCCQEMCPYGAIDLKRKFF